MSRFFLYACICWCWLAGLDSCLAWHPAKPLPVNHIPRYHVRKTVQSHSLTSLYSLNIEHRKELYSSSEQAESSVKNVDFSAHAPVDGPPVEIDEVLTLSSASPTDDISTQSISADIVSLEKNELKVSPTKWNVNGIRCIVGGILTHLTLGTIYCWGNFLSYAPPSLKYFNPQSSALDLTTPPDALCIIPITFVAQISMMPFANKFFKAMGAKRTLLLGK